MEVSTIPPLMKKYYRYQNKITAALRRSNLSYVELETGIDVPELVKFMNAQFSQEIEINEEHLDILIFTFELFPDFGNRNKPSYGFLPEPVRKANFSQMDINHMRKCNKEKEFLAAVRDMKVRKSLRETLRSEEVSALIKQFE